MMTRLGAYLDLDHKEFKLPLREIEHTAQLIIASGQIYSHCQALLLF